MSLTYLTDCPLLLETDFVRLHHDAKVDGATIKDTVITVNHTLRLDASLALQLLSEGVCVRRLYQDSLLERESVIEILGFCNKLGILRVQRGVTQRLRAIPQIAQDCMMGIFYTTLSRRYKPTFLMAILAVSRACAALIAVSVLVSFCIFLGFTVNIGTIALSLFGALAVFIGCVSVHEYGHLLALRLYRVNATLYQHGMTVRIIHKSLSTRQEVRVGLAGPSLGLLYIGVAWIALLPAHIASKNVFMIATSILNCINLLPWYADGKSIFCNHKGTV